MEALARGRLHAAGGQHGLAGRADRRRASARDLRGRPPGASFILARRPRLRRRARNGRRHRARAAAAGRVVLGRGGRRVRAAVSRSRRTRCERFAAGGQLAHLWLVPNPAHNPRGDFGLSADGLGAGRGDAALHLLDHRPVSRRAVRAAVLRDRAGQSAGREARAGAAAARGHEKGPGERQLYPGPWTDVGTPQRLSQLDQST